MQFDRVANSTGGTNQAINDNTTGVYRLNTTSGNKTPRQPANGETTVNPAFFLTKEAPAAGETRRAAYGRMLTAHPQFARATVNYLWKEVFGLGSFRFQQPVMDAAVFFGWEDVRADGEVVAVAIDEFEGKHSRKA